MDLLIYLAMKKFSVLLFFLLTIMFALPVMAQETLARDPQKIKAQVAIIEKEIVRLEKKLGQVTEKTQQEKLTRTIYGHYARLRKLERLLQTEPQPAQPESEINGELIRLEPKKQAKARPRFVFEIGGTVGLFSSASAINGEIRFPLRYIIGPANTSLRFISGYMQTEETDRRYVPVQIDAILNYPAGWFTGVENYWGAGLNYVLLTSGGKSGSFGAQLFYGIETDGLAGKLFGEIGLGILRTGFSPSYKGVTVLVGYRKNWSF